MDHPTDPDPTDPDPTPDPAGVPSSGRALRAALAGAPPLDAAFESDIAAATDVLTGGDPRLEEDG